MKIRIRTVLVLPEPRKKLCSTEIYPAITIMALYMLPVCINLTWSWPEWSGVYLRLAMEQQKGWPFTSFYLVFGIKIKANS